MLQFNVLQRDGRVNLWIKQLQKKIQNTHPQSTEHCHDHQLQVHVLCISLNPTPVITVKK